MYCVFRIEESIHTCVLDHAFINIYMQAHHSVVGNIICMQIVQTIFHTIFNVYAYIVTSRESICSYFFI